MAGPAGFEPTSDGVKVLYTESVWKWFWGFDFFIY